MTIFYNFSKNIVEIHRDNTILSICNCENKNRSFRGNCGKRGEFFVVGVMVVQWSYKGVKTHFVCLPKRTKVCVLGDSW